MDLALDQLLELMMKEKATDLHLKAGRPPLFRVGGQMTPTELERLKPEDVKTLVYSIMNSDQRARFETKHELDFGYAVPKLSRFRVNVFFQRGTVEAVFRAIPFEVPTVEELGLPDVCKDLALLQQGIVIVAGPTGSGKSTTLAAIIEHINRNRKCHIVTLEEPIEYLFRDKNSSVSQREIGFDTFSYEDALKYVLRQDPDVILIGEIRDLQTVRIAIKAGEIGHLVLSTLHTLDAAQTVDRMVSFYPEHEQHQVRVQLSLLLQGVVCQRLLRTPDGKARVAAVEVMTGSPQIQKLIHDGSIEQINDAISKSVVHYKMQTLTQSLVALYLSNTVTQEEAVSAAPHADEFKRVLHEFQSGKIGGAEPVRTSEEDYYK